jgi:glycosyltransferase involved in cell wall biosynthesis
MVVAATAATLEAIHRHYGTTRSSRVICNGRDASMYAPAAKRKVVLSAGRLWDEAMNLATLERAAEMIHWPVEVAGSLDHPDGRRVASSLVHLLGELESEQLAKAYACASVYALPAKYEPFGLPVLEAALSGCALVLGDIPSLREVWGEAATYVSPGDPGELAGAVNGLVQDNARRAGMALMAWRRGLMYSPRRMANGYVEAYRELLGGRWRLPLSEAKAHVTMHA